MADRGKAGLIPAAVAGFLAAASVAAAGAWQVVKMDPSDRILKNRDSGLAFMAGLVPASEIPEWVLETCSTAYFRVNWADVVDAQGRPRFEELDAKVFSTYRKHGLAISFRLMAANMHSSEKHVTPKAVLDRGIPAVTHRSVYGQEQVDPVFWDERFVKEYNSLTRALGEFLDGKAWAGHVDLGGMGEWGEMHLSRWTDEQLKSAGYSPERYLAAVFSMMDEMDRSLPRVVKSFCVAPILMPDPGPLFAQIVDRAVRKGWWLRSDGCSTGGPPPYVKPYAEKFWKRTGLICEPSGGINREYGGGTAPVADYFAANLKYHPSVMNIMGMWDLEKLTAAERMMCADAARKVGSRLAVERVTIPESLARLKDGSCWLAGRVRVVQRGVAPYRGTAAIALAISGPGLHPVRRLVYPVPPLSELLPGEKRDEGFLFQVSPAEGAEEMYLRVGVHDLDRGPVELGNERQDEAGWLPVGAVAVPSPAGGNARTVFDAGRDGVRAAEGVQIEKTGTGARLKGTSASGWSYATGPSGTGVKRGCIYVMRVRVRAGGNDPGALYFKFGVDDKRGKWAGNFNSPKYDFAAAGTWQVLEIVYRPRPGDAKLMVAIEKGTTSPAGIDAEIGDWTVAEIPVPE